MWLKLPMMDSISLAKGQNKGQIVTRVNCVMNGSLEIQNKKLKGKEYTGFIEFLNLKMNSRYTTLKKPGRGADLKEKKSEW